MRELLERIDSAELSEWLAFNNLEPLPDPHFSAALICATQANCAGAKPKRVPADFLPRRKKRRQSTREMLDRMRTFSAQHNARQQQ